MDTRPASTTGLYPSLLAEAWTELADPIRHLHDARPLTLAHGRFKVVRGRGTLARLVASALRLPPENAATDLRLEIVRQGRSERWQRQFDGRRLDTTQEPSGDGTLREHFGPIEFTFALRAVAGSLVHVQQTTAFVLGPMRLALPAWTTPRVSAREDADGGNRVKVAVRVDAPGLGMLVAYDGVVAVEAEHV